MESESNGTLSEILAATVVQQHCDGFPANVMFKAKQYALDIMGCCLGASHEPQSRMLLEVIKAQGGHPQSSVLGHGRKTSALHAALFNGTTGHILDFDDDHRESAMHPSTAVFPAVLAVAEERGLSGKKLLEAFILGDEVAVRIGEAFLGLAGYQGFHATGTCGTFGAAAGCARALGLDREGVTQALGLAGSFTAGSNEWRAEDSWQKPLNPGHAAMSGVMAAYLAEKGFRASAGILDGPDGFIRAHAYQDRYDTTRVVENIGQQWKMADISIKIHAGCRWAEAAVDAAMEALARDASADNIQHLLIRTSAMALEILTTPEALRRRPTTRTDAQFSLPYMVACALVHGRVDVPHFQAEMLDHPIVLNLIDKTTWELSPEAEAIYPNAFSAELVVTLTDGRRESIYVKHPLGDPENPATAAQLEDKFVTLTRDRLSPGNQTRVIDAVGSLEQLADIRQLTALMG